MIFRCRDHAGWQTESPFEAQRHRWVKHKDDPHYALETEGEPERFGRPYTPPPGRWDPLERLEKVKESRGPEPDEPVRPSEGMQVKPRGKSAAARIIR